MMDNRVTLLWLCFMLFLCLYIQPTESLGGGKDGGGSGSGGFGYWHHHHNSNGGGFFKPGPGDKKMLVVCYVVICCIVVAVPIWYIRAPSITTTRKWAKRFFINPTPKESTCGQKLEGGYLVPPGVSANDNILNFSTGGWHRPNEHCVRTKKSICKGDSFEVSFFLNPPSQLKKKDYSFGMFKQKWGIIICGDRTNTM
jgi:hypothetical protein